jgi:hypothetical protein
MAADGDGGAVAPAPPAPPPPLPAAPAPPPAPPAPPPPPAPAPCDPEFLAWARGVGLAAPAVEPAFFAEGWRGVAAAARVAPGDVLVAAPEALLMSGASAARDAALGPLLARPEHAALSDHQVSAGGLGGGRGARRNERWAPSDAATAAAARAP